MAHFKLNEDDNHFLQVPQDATLIFAGLGGTETWIERAEDQVVRIGVKSVGVATGGGGALEVCVEIGRDVARGQDGPAAPETQLRASQAVQTLVKAGERLAFKAYPKATDAHVLRTVVWAADMPAPQAANDRHNGAQDGHAEGEHRGAEP
ncbi:MAG TPA: hypothetical protein VHS81_12575 [Caulobacteraceae bacterium]|jgi:hypothetical protein|nr:hypothetical protein [Caulobacteraceae bacterium]